MDILLINHDIRSYYLTYFMIFAITMAVNTQESLSILLRHPFVREENVVILQSFYFLIGRS